MKVSYLKLGEEKSYGTTPIRKPIPTWVNFAIGGLSGMLAICFVQPADLTKTRMQLAGPKGEHSLLGVARFIYKNEGIKGFYKGLTAALFRQATYSTTRLGCFYEMTDHYTRAYGTPSFPLKLVMGMVSGGIGAFVGTPAEVALIRMTADGQLPPEKRRNYKHVFNALSRIVNEEGVLTLWRGTLATVTRAMVVNAAELGTYAQLRQLLLPKMGDGVPLHFTASMIAGFITSGASLPVDIVKTRVQNAAKGTSQLSVLRSVIKNEGFLALWSGFLPTWAKIGPHAVLQFIFLEQLNNLYRKKLLWRIDVTGALVGMLGPLGKSTGYACGSEQDRVIMAPGVGNLKSCHVMTIEQESFLNNTSEMTTEWRVAFPYLYVDLR